MERKTLEQYTEIIVETDEENPTSIAIINTEKIDVAEGYRVRLIPKGEEIIPQKG